MPNADVLVHELLDEGLADWVPLTRITGYAREAVATDGGDHREVATALIARLIEEGLMVPGDLGPQWVRGMAGGAA
ncbi:hypothetical protein AB0B39_20410 [Micromonospora sp. NPDC049114]|uniref:hypothetical protein n=1 Tax=Micromonospora sp. NPDC049114 TaxID=3155498 RepID=UPI0034108DC6